MPTQFARSHKAAEALGLVRELQHLFATALDDISRSFGTASQLEPVEWERDGGLHGGGVRLCTADSPVFNRASVNVS
ncbi:MAG: coproporphyrinogen III oxidase, partial [Candidatus Paceibacteria bacterium]